MIKIKQILTFLVLTAVLISCGENKESVKPIIQNLTESVYASVTVQPEGISKVFSFS